MRKLLLFLIPLFAISACKKETASENLVGLWIETTMRLDTIDFDNGRLYSSTPSFDFRSQPYRSLYNYSLQTDSIRLRSIFSSYSGFYSYFYRREESRRFTIDNFYNRPGLPARIRFERIR